MLWACKMQRGILLLILPLPQGSASLLSSFGCPLALPCENGAMALPRSPLPGRFQALALQSRSSALAPESSCSALAPQPGAGSTMYGLSPQMPLPVTCWLREQVAEGV